MIDIGKVKLEKELKIDRIIRQLRDIKYVVKKSSDFDDLDDKKLIIKLDSADELQHTKRFQTEMVPIYNVKEYPILKAQHILETKNSNFDPP